VLAVVQDRARQKEWLAEHDFPIGPFRTARSEAGVERALRELGPCMVKSTTGGYDGRSQQPVTSPAAAGAAWRALGGRPVVVEALLELEREISVLVARRPGGESAVYPPALNHHAERILDWSVIPAPLPAALSDRARKLGSEIAQALGVEGLLAVEMFEVAGELLVNELAPRPHNSFHHTEVACVTSQFEQAVRTVCDLPLGAVEVVRPAALVNLLGDLWLGSKAPAFEEVLALPGVKLFLYGKQEARPGRKMGHLCAVGLDPEQAVERARSAREKLAQAAAATVRQPH
jgi:5-(carboxyamino)imidazole ribonucleotide synthase